MYQYQEARVQAYYRFRLTASKKINNLMQDLQSRFVLYVLCLCFTACVIPETKQGLEEFRLVNGDIEKVVYQVEVASDNASRKHGLMYRDALPENQGMLLDYKRSAQMAIWMKNTYIPLDIIFIDAGGVIVKMHEGAVPHSTTRIESDSKVRAVLEVNAGQILKHGIELGDQLKHASFPNK
jgi:uncharacterized membrane protein (UPF0127 family)